jgi:hypothetical protein
MNTSSSFPMRNGAGVKRANPTAARARAGVKRPGAPKLHLEAISREARQQAAAILEVLAGVRTPIAAAQQLAISLPRYYAVELRALQAMVVACEPRPKGRIRSPASELAALHRECDQLRRACARQQTLLRAAQRTIGLVPPPSVKPAAGGKKRRQRKPTVRALKAVGVLREEAMTGDPATSTDRSHS